jgi:hypothetical protein
MKLNLDARKSAFTMNPGDKLLVSSLMKISCQSPCQQRRGKSGFPEPRSIRPPRGVVAIGISLHISDLGGVIRCSLQGAEYPNRQSGWYIPAATTLSFGAEVAANCHE